MRPESIVLHTKLTPPRRSKRTLARPRLRARLRHALDYRLTIVQAGAGYGKSTALARLAEEPAPLVWYHIDAEDADPYLFLTYLLHGFAGAFEGVAARALAMLEDTTGGSPAWRAVVDTFINDFAASVSEPVLLVLDDAHLLHAQSLAVLERFIKHAPDNLHIILAVRHPPRLESLVIWRVRGDVLEIGEEELAFTREEIEALFAGQYGLELAGEELDAIAQQTEGWAIALQLIWQGLPQGQTDGLPGSLERLAGLKGDLFTYLAQEVLNQQPERLRSFLVTTSVLRTMTPAICDCLCDRDDSAAVLAELSEAGLFVLPSGGVAVRYHPLFGEFLYHHLSTEEARAHHHRAAQCCSARGEGEEAIPHFLQAEAYPLAADWIAELGGEMVRAGRLATLSGWIGRLPAHTLEERPALLIYLGDTARLRSRFDEALRWYAQAEERFRGQGSTSGVARALRGQARVYLDTVNPSRAERFLREALRLTDGLDNRDMRASLLELLAENQINMGHSDQALDLQQQVTALREEGPGEAELAVRVLLRTGRLEQARRILEHRAQEETDQPVMRPRAHRETLLLLALIRAFQREAEGAYAAAREGTERGRALESPFVAAVGLMRQGHALLIQDPPRLEEARQRFEEAITYSETLAVLRLKVEAFWGLCRMFGLRSDLERAHHAAAMGLNIAEDAGDAWIAAHIRLAMGATYAQAGEHQNALAWLGEAYTGFYECGDTFGQAAARLWQCLIWHTDDDSAYLEHGLADLIALVEAHGHTALFTQRTLLGPVDPPRLIPLLIAAREGGHRYTEHILRQMGLAGVEHHPGYRLHVQTLGTFRVWRGDEEITTGDWGREKARQMFQMFLTERRTLIDKERVCGLLWPDLDEDAAGRSFRVTLNTLYRVLEPNRGRGAPSAYIVRESSLYGLRPEADIDLDSETFEEAVHTGDSLYSGDPAASLPHYKKALGLYEGDYLAEFPYDEWLRDERIRLRAMYMRVGERAARILVEQGAHEEALDVCGRVIAQDNCWENAYRLMMVAYDRMGNRPQALRTFHQLEESLRTELDTVPSQETLALYEALSEQPPGA